MNDINARNYGKLFLFLMAVEAGEHSFLIKKPPFLFFGINQIRHFIPVFLFRKKFSHDGIEFGSVITLVILFLL